MFRSFFILNSEVQEIKTLNLNYFYGSESEQFAFYRIPRVLMTEPYFKKLSCDAKILYGLMLDRMSLSMKNEWIDKENRVYIFFTLEDVQENLNCGHTKGVKILAELDKNSGIGLIERVKQGQGKPTRIYVKNFILPVDNPVENFENDDNGSQGFTKSEVQTSVNEKSRLHENGSADFQNTYTNQTYRNQTDFNHIEHQSIYPPAHAQSAQPFPLEKINMLTMIESYKKIIRENIDYEILIDRYDVTDIDEYVRIMLDAICSPKKTVRVDCAEYPAEVVKSRLLKLESSHIEYVLFRMSKNTTKVWNIKNYILTALYNSYTTMNNFYKAEVNHDLYGEKNTYFDKNTFYK